MSCSVSCVPCAKIDLAVSSPAAAGVIQSDRKDKVPSFREAKHIIATKTVLHKLKMHSMLGDLLHSKHDQHRAA